MDKIKKYWKGIVTVGIILGVLAGFAKSGKEIYGFINDTYPAFEKNFNRNEYISKLYKKEYTLVKELNIGLQRKFIEQKFNVSPRYVSNYSSCKEYKYKKTVVDSDFNTDYNIQLTVDSEDNILRYAIWTWDQNFKAQVGPSGAVLNEDTLNI